MMSTTSTFYVSKKSNRLLKANDNPTNLIRSGKALYIIEVFGYQHKINALRIKKLIEDNGLDNHYFKIKIETK